MFLLKASTLGLGRDFFAYQDFLVFRRVPAKPRHWDCYSATITTQINSTLNTALFQTVQTNRPLEQSNNTKLATILKVGPGHHGWPLTLNIFSTGGLADHHRGHGRCRPGASPTGQEGPPHQGEDRARPADKHRTAKLISGTEERKITHTPPVKSSQLKSILFV